MNLTSDYPFWLVKNGIQHTFHALDRDVRCEVLVIGGGITGAMAAFELINKGYDVVVTDGRHAGSGSTGGSTALIQYETDNGLVDLARLYGEKKANKYFRLSYNAVANIASLVKDHHIDCDFRKRNSLYVASKNEDVEMMKEEYRLRKKAGYSVSYWDENEISKKFPLTAPAALWSEDSCEMDPFRFTIRLLEMAATMGARIHNNTFIRELQNGRKEVTAVTATNNRIIAKHVVVACGYESEFFLEKKYSRLKSTYAIVSEPLKNSGDPWYESCLIWETARPYLFLRTTPDKRMMIGGLDEDFYNPRKRDELLKKKAKELKALFTDRFPYLPFKTDFAWTGTFAESKDSLPYIGRLTPKSRIIYAIGFGGNGITFGQLAAGLLPRLLKQPDNATVSLFSFKR